MAIGLQNTDNVDAPDDEENSEDAKDNARRGEGREYDTQIERRHHARFGPRSGDS